MTIPGDLGARAISRYLITTKSTSGVRDSFIVIANSESIARSNATKILAEKWWSTTAPEIVDVVKVNEHHYLSEIRDFLSGRRD